VVADDDGAAAVVMDYPIAGFHLRRKKGENPCISIIYTTTGTWGIYCTEGALFV
jgi:hypothetical protein